MHTHTPAVIPANGESLDIFHRLPLATVGRQQHVREAADFFFFFYPQEATEAQLASQTITFGVLGEERRSGLPTERQNPPLPRRWREQQSELGGGTDR